MKYSARLIAASGLAAVVAGQSLPAGSINAANAATTFSFSLQATNPTAVPLASIVSFAPSIPPATLTATPVAGSKPTGIPSAPAVPDVTLNLANYPTPDRPIENLNSPEMQQWKKEIAASGVKIPDLSLTVKAGACGENAAAAADTTRCWWTCTGCTRSTDVTDCPTQRDWGVTFDDGPAEYTPNLLNYLQEKNIKVTFFNVGSRVLYNPKLLQAEYLAGHQIAIHTWSHFPLTTLSTDQIIAELGWSKKIIKDVLGVTPNMMRPPFGDIDDRVRAIAQAMGLTPVMWTRISPTQTFNTNDFDIHGGFASAQFALNSWNAIMANVSTRSNGFIALQHDLFREAVDLATGYILPDALAHQPALNLQPVIQCLKKSAGDAYIETNNNKTNPPTTSPGNNSTTGGANQGGKGNGALPLYNVATIGLVALGALSLKLLL